VPQINPDPSQRPSKKPFSYADRVAGRIVPGAAHKTSAHSLTYTPFSDTSSDQRTLASTAEKVSSGPVNTADGVFRSEEQRTATVSSSQDGDPVEAQKKLWADKHERARLKEQQEREADQKEKIERKERLIRRLAAIGPGRSESQEEGWSTVGKPSKKK